MTETNNTKLTQKKWFKWTLGISGVAVVALAITLPIVLLSGDSSRKQLETKQQVWATQTAGISDPTQGGYELESSEGSTPISKMVIDNLSKNTLYYGWYSTTDFRNEQGFKDFQTEWSKKVIDAAAYSQEVIEGLPVIKDNVTSSAELNAYWDEVNVYLQNSIDQTKTFWTTLFGQESVWSSWQQTSYAATSGSISLKYASYDDVYIIEGRYDGQVSITQQQIDSGSSDLPEVYQFNSEVLEASTKLVTDYVSFMTDYWENIISEETYNLITRPEKPSYDDAKTHIQKSMDAFGDAVVTNIIS